MSRGIQSGLIGPGGPGGPVGPGGLYGPVVPGGPYGQGCQGQGGQDDQGGQVVRRSGRQMVQVLRWSGGANKAYIAPQEGRMDISIKA